MTTQTELMESQETDLADSNSISLPVGCVLPYVADGTTSNIPDGWKLCNGVQVSKDTYGELFDVIGTAYGGTGTPYFNLPDYQGWFLRGADRGAGRDPDVSSRTIDSKTGNTYLIGSTQLSGTAFEDSSDAHVQPNNSLPKGSTHYAYKGTTLDVARNNDGSVKVTTQGWDKESRPINAYVNFIIKCDSSSTGIPLGTVVAYVGQDEVVSKVLPSSDWVYCNGDALPETAGDLSSLIGVIWGGDAAAPLSPDLRGFFLRGVAGGSTADPDSSTRTAIHDDGNSGDKVASMQTYATGKPANEIYFEISHLPVGHFKSSFTSGHTPAKWTNGSTTVDIKFSVGEETRPVNAYVKWYVKATNASEEETIPVGIVVAYAGVANQTNNSLQNGLWLRCVGTSFDRTEYSQLYETIGVIHGSEGGYPYLPDYQGRFLRGVDDGAKRDPDASSRTAPGPDGTGHSGDQIGSVQGWDTGEPNETPSVDLPHLPTSSTQTAAALGGGTIRDVGSGDPTFNFQGADAESRPRNVYVDWIISASNGSSDTH
ncbi:MAG: tail fiber protein [Symploca sp. SIO1A3]|nr:tail fiber protein [Symploca sp. SIO2C1]NER51169.1 tail fiber protein [Symploca sp. SIO1A3]